MGVPAFYKWLVDKYPEIVCDANPNPSQKNPNPDPNGLEFDNLYLDMNGIIHPCFHPEDDNLIPPTTFNDVFENIYEYIDKIVDIVRPQKLLFLAIDGVAPRAKMNQQRARRFKTAKENEFYEEVEKKFLKEFEMHGKKVLPREETEVADSNIITPGTEFMHLLSKKLQCYIKLRMSDDARWRTIKVILSDANVPGEGEHKIMSFIRSQRCSEGYNPNTRHCLYGLDADLIMLALATHEVHFSIIREFVGRQQQSVPESYHPEVTSGLERSDGGSEHRTPAKNTHFQFLKVWLLREYLLIDMHISNPPENVKMDTERTIDDFIFMCFFAGNDFLPHTPTLEIHEGAIDLLIHVYKNEFKNLGGYLVDIQKIEDKKNGYIRLKRVEKFILSVGEFEEKIFKKRTEIFERKMRRILSQQLNDVEDEDQGFGSLNLPSSLVSEKGSVNALPSSNFGEEGSCTSTDMSELLKNTKELKQKVKDYIRSQSDTFKSGAALDKVKLASPGFKGRYYRLKFSTKSPEEMEHTRKELVQKYTEGLVWVLKYYYSEVPSWNWFYPYHYGPFVSDLKGLAQVKVQFQKGLPLKPYEQLLAVLPPKSARALPDTYHKLMVDNDSGIADFYPTYLQMDADGKRFMWQAVCKLPFIDENRLIKETAKVEEELKEYEKDRNAESTDRLFIGVSSSLVEQISEVYRSNNNPLSQNGAIKIDSELSDGLNGVMHFCEENEEMPSVFCLFYKLAEGCNSKHHLLEGVTIPEKTITEADMVEKQLWHELNGFPTHRAPVRQDKEADIIDARGGWGRGRGNFEDPRLVARQTTSWRPYACDSSLNMSFETQCTLSGPDHGRNRWRGTSQGPLQNSFASNMRSSCPQVKEAGIIHRDAAVGWGRGRGRFDHYSLQTAGRGTAFQSYPGRNLATSTYSTSAGRPNPNLSREEQYSLSGGFCGRNDAGSACSAGPWRNNAPTGASSAGSRPNSPSFARAVWMPSRPISPSFQSYNSAGRMPSRPISSSSGSGGQQSYGRGRGRGQYIHETATSSWSSQSRHRNNYQ